MADIQTLMSDIDTWHGIVCSIFRCVRQVVVAVVVTLSQIHGFSCNLWTKTGTE